MRKLLDAFGRKLIIIIDPNFNNTNGSNIATAGQAHHTGLTASTPPLSTDWWNGLFDYTVFKGTMVNNFIWKDMNEPSVFNGPEIIMPKDNLRFGG
ncbi:hypothetical protein FOWG_11987 [Fusarium oxysporum f. sp. lycopersici MN25]|uniref:Glycoside hydrolase family 31 TIM barrel domain-containing protein n=1 Tax=Fusarium oxysporum Fo47 TaxID=660027 RepID=W9JGG1_FUSOX|nr:hypothetical protein FOZG_17597 [Fusarium oxysporum Fo47]EWZ85492.1 hypothetical protein FOWG_11987 [Fusarium oxysporum f. sp. lycopersici MN25]